jgi:hypothetical protein
VRAKLESPAWASRCGWAGRKGGAKRRPGELKGVWVLTGEWNKFRTRDWGLVMVHSQRRPGSDQERAEMDDRV